MTSGVKCSLQKNIKFQTCCVPQCHSDSTSHPDIFFCRFPRYGEMGLGTNTVWLQDRRKMWIDALKVEGPISNCMLVCSRHFKKEDYIVPDVPAKCPYLKKTAVPSCNLPLASLGQLNKGKDRLGMQTRRTVCCLEEEKTEVDTASAVAGAGSIRGPWKRTKERGRRPRNKTHGTVGSRRSLRLSRIVTKSSDGIVDASVPEAVYESEDKARVEWLQFVEDTDFYETYPLPDGGEDSLAELARTCPMALEIHSRSAYSQEGSGESVACKQVLLEALPSARLSLRRIHALRLHVASAVAQLKEESLRSKRKVLAMDTEVLRKNIKIKKLKLDMMGMHKPDQVDGPGHDEEVATDDVLVAKGVEAAGGDVVSAVEEPLVADGNLLQAEEFTIKEEPVDEDVCGDEADMPRMCHSFLRHDFVEGHCEEEEVTADEEVSAGQGVNVAEGGEDVSGEGETVGAEELFEVEEFTIKEEPADEAVCGEEMGSTAVCFESMTTRSKVTKPTEDLTETLNLAIKKVTVDRWSLWKAGNHYGISWKTLQRHIKDRKVSRAANTKDKSENSHQTTSFSLSAVSEADLLTFIKEMKQRGFGVCADRLRQMACVLAEREQVERPADDGGTVHRCSSEIWLEDFCKRNKIVLEAPGVPPGIVPDDVALSVYYDKIRKLRNHMGIALNPAQIWNCCDVRLDCSFLGENETVLSSRDACDHTGRRYNHTVLMCANAAGTAGPTMVVSKDNHVPEAIESVSSSEMLKVSSKTGCLDHGLFAVWFQEFQRETKADGPQILLLDSQRNHLSPEVIDSAAVHGVLLVPIPFRSSGLRQPVQVSLINPFLISCQCRFKDFQVQEEGSSDVPLDYHGMIEQAFKEVISEDRIIAGFCKTGFYPPHHLVLNAAVVQSSGTLQSSAVLVKSEVTEDEGGRLAEFIRTLHSPEQL